jgi:sterol desaturase/sphingolipid hydroxylase (fatty acid hydroxylase superfamily)
MTDPLTAPADAVARRRADRLTLADCFRQFMRMPSPPWLAAALVLAGALRVALGHFDWRDVVVAAGVLALTPPVEWLIHVYLLHARPIPVFGRRLDLLAAREHRAHHEAPAHLEGVLIPVYALFIFFAEIALTVWLVSWPIHWIFGGDRLAHGATGLLVAVAVLAGYEWSHYLIHTPYRPRGRYYRAIWRGHRLHHYKNEHYWFGVTSPLADRLLGTAPAQQDVPRSPTARHLGGDVTGTPPAARA